MKLLELALKAHGGLARWNTFNRVSAAIVGGGGLWPMKNAALDPSPRKMTVALHEERASVTPFGQPDWRTSFTPDPMRSRKPWCFSRPTRAATSPERNCLWMAVSHKSRPLTFFDARTTR